MAASSDSTIRTRNTGVTENSTRIGGGFSRTLDALIAMTWSEITFQEAESGLEGSKPQIWALYGVVPVEPLHKVHVADVLLNLLPGHALPTSLLAFAL